MTNSQNRKNVLLAIPYPLLVPLDEIVRTQGYLSRTNAMVEAIREFVDKRKRHVSRVLSTDEGLVSAYDSRPNLNEENHSYE